MDDFFYGSDYDAYQPYELPSDYGGWSGDQGWDQGGFSVDNSLPSSYDWSTDMTGMGFGAPQQQMDLPQYEMTNPGSQWAPPSMGEAGPSVGQGGRGPAEDDLWSQIKKAGLGMGVGLLSQGAGAGLQALMAPKQQQAQRQGLPAPSAGQQYTPEALEPRPGTKASPLISGRPKQVLGSAGLKERRPNYGGFSMF